MIHKSIYPAVELTLMPLPSVFLTSCDNDEQADAPPLEVQVASVEQRDVPIYREWVGTLEPTGH